MVEYANEADDDEAAEEETAGGDLNGVASDKVV